MTAPDLVDVDEIALGDVAADFAAAAREWPERPAVSLGHTSITYRELAARVRRLARVYRSGGPREGGSPGFVGAVVAHTPAVAEHLLGILQAGGTYCPIDAALPATRKQTVAAALGVDRLVAVAEDPGDTADLRIERIGHDPVETAGDVLEFRCESDDPAYVLCTSGSTGVPKPVVVSRRALTVAVRALREVFELTPQDRVLQFASLGWDTCLEEILPALTAGATLVFDDMAQCGSFPLFLRMLAERGITVLDLPTAFWHELVLYLHDEGVALPECVRLVVIGGEQVDPNRLRQWRALDVGRVRLLNTYGCTETTLVTHAVQLAGPGTEVGLVARDVEAPLGRPLPHVRDRVTDEGELLVSGPSLASGYLGLPEVTARSFPVADHGDGPRRWFGTGDVVERGADGLLYGRGRLDEQVKVRGVRVHPTEVEAQLNTHPAVVGAVVVGERLLERTSLSAYVVATRHATASELKEYLSQRLPAQFVPSRVTFVAQLAHTSSGKVDRAATRLAAMETDSKGAV